MIFDGHRRRRKRRAVPTNPLIYKEDPNEVRRREAVRKERLLEDLPDDWTSVNSLPDIGNVMNSPEIMGIIETAQSLGLNQIRVNEKDTGDPGMDGLIQRLKKEDVLFRF